MKPSPGCFVIRKMQGIEQCIVFYHMCVRVCVLGACLGALYVSGASVCKFSVFAV